MGENTFSVQKDTLVSLLMALMQWRGWNIWVKEIRIQIFPVCRPGEIESSAYKAVVTYLDR